MRLEVIEPLVLSYATAAPQLLRKRAGCREVNLRGHVPETCGWPLPYTRIIGEGFSALSRLALYADNLTQRVYHVHQVTLCFHHGVDGLVCHRSLVDDVRVLTALDAGSCLSVIV